MAATGFRLGIDHVTVVPTNLRRDDAEDPGTAADDGCTADPEAPPRGPR